MTEIGNIRNVIYKLLIRNSKGRNSKLNRSDTNMSCREKLNLRSNRKKAEEKLNKLKTLLR